MFTNTKELGFIDKDGKTRPFSSSEWRVCLYCGTPITEVNDSGWERFTATPGVTCPTCIDCEEKIDSRCLNCGWEGNENKTVLHKITEEIAEPGFCPVCDAKCQEISASDIRKLI